MGELRSPHLQYSLIHSVVILGRGSSQISDLHLQSPISNVVILGRIQSDLRSPSPISNLQSRFGGPGEEGGSNLQGDALWIHSQCKRISTLFSRHFAISSRPTRSLGAFGAKSESPPLSQKISSDCTHQLEISDSSRASTPEKICLHQFFNLLLLLAGDLPLKRSLKGIYDLQSKDLPMLRRDVHVHVWGGRPPCPTN